MRLMSDEQMLIHSNPEGISLTTHRVRQHFQSRGQAQVTSIMLEEVASCSMERRSQPWILALALLVFLGSIVVGLDSRDGEMIIIGGVVVALVLVFIYFGTRRQTLAIESAGDDIFQSVTGMKQDSVLEFIEQLEEAKHKRLMLLRGRQP